jgi:hypothetical protein
VSASRHQPGPYNAAVNLELSPEERTLLLEILRNDFGQLRSEIYHTEGADWKAGLKEREALLQAIIRRLETASPH